MSPLGICSTITLQSTVPSRLCACLTRCRRKEVRDNLVCQSGYCYELSICFITKKLDNATELLSSHESSGAGAPSIYIFVVVGRLSLFTPICIFYHLLNSPLVIVEARTYDNRGITWRFARSEEILGLPYSSLPPLHKTFFLNRRRLSRRLYSGRNIYHLFTEYYMISGRQLIGLACVKNLACFFSNGFFLFFPRLNVYMQFFGF